MPGVSKYMPVRERENADNDSSIITLPFSRIRPITMQCARHGARCCAERNESPTTVRLALPVAMSTSVQTLHQMEWLFNS